MRLANKVVIITGAGRGLGRAAALIMAAEGARVAVCDRDAGPVEETVQAVQAAGGQALACVADVTDRPALAAMVERVVAAWGAVDVLINNAGITADSTLAKMTEEQFDRVIAVNLKGVFNCTQAVLPQMLAQGRGRIVNTSSIVGLQGNFGQTNYAAAKAGLVGMTRTWARELGRKGITVNAVAPGFIATEMTAAMPEKVLQMMQDRTPLGRLGMPEEVASAYLFLASDDASYINGHVLSVDGGMTL
ncbi:MAG: 3-oxoacyl-[acyl-carrier-protein] reductase [Nevskia sp.]|nr:3-oxoacyl-[acyl-carrier-protein] reductase [Nevskia sp.]